MSNQSNSWWTQAVQNRLIALVLAMVVIVTLVASPANNAQNGIAALAFEGLAVLLFATLLWRSRWNFTRQKVTEFLRTGPNLPILLFLGVALVSCALSSNKAFSIQETTRIAAGVLLYFVVAYQFRRSEHLSKLFDTLLFVGVAASLYGFVQYSTGETLRAAGPFGNPQLLASFLMILLPIVAVVAITERKAGRQLAAQVATVLMAACLLLTQTRSAWLGSAVGLGVLAILAIAVAARNRPSSLASRKHELVLPAVMLVGVIVFLALWPQTNTLLQRATTFSNVSAQATFQSRQAMWRDAASTIASRPLTGIGVGLYPVRYSAAHPSLSNDPHNFWLKTAAEMGIPAAMLVALALAAFLFVGLRRAYTMDAGIRRSLLMGAIAATVAFAVDAVSNPSWGLAQTSMFFWLVLGLGVGALRPFARQRETLTRPALAPRFARPAVALASLALAAFVLPTATRAAVDPQYLQSIDLRPDVATLRSGQALAFTVIATYGTDGSTTEVDVTDDPATNYSATPGTLGGMLSGGDKNVLQTRPRSTGSIAVTAEFLGQTDTSSVTLTR
ncbi:MAG: O-antigen ligase family protein [Chthonomonadales bacterium]|nr:O-antigen ligase family protein [Chthonomonadales bacterium]